MPDSAFSPSRSTTAPTSSEPTVEDWVGLARKARTSGELEAAADAYRGALTRDPSNHDVRLQLAAVLWDLQACREMLEILRPIGPEDESFAAAENMRGYLHMNLGKPRHARDCFRRALEEAPSQVSYYSNFLLSLLYDVQLSPEKVAQAHADFGRQAASVPGANRLVETAREPQRRLKIGFLSSDFRMHSVAYFLEPLLASWNHEEAEVVLYSGVRDPDDMTALLAKHADALIPVSGLEVDAVVERIRADQPDIVIELSGHTGGNFISVLSQRVAPLQLSWLGYPHSTGLPSIDGRLSDAYLEALPSAQKLSVEPVLHLPRVAFAYRMPGASIPLEPLPAERNGYVTFVSCNNAAKLSEPVLELWVSILERLPRSRLLIKNRGVADEIWRNEICALFEQAGIEPSRVEFRAPTASIYEHLQIYGEADIALDTYPYNGTTTTCEALWMGVPVLTLVGQSPVTRHAARILDALGLADWVTLAAEAYVDRAVEAARDLGALAGLRADLRTRFEHSPLADYGDFAKDYQRTLRGLWKQHCGGKSLEQATLPGTEERARLKALRKEGIAAVEAMDWEAAVAAFSQIHARHPDDSEALGFLGLIEKTRGNLDAALKHWREAIKRSPQNPGLWGNLGDVLRHLRKLSEAEDALLRAVALKADKHDARLGLATVQWDQRKIAEALESLQKIPPGSKEGPGAKNLEGNILSHLGHPAAAQEAYRAAMEGNPKSALYHSNYLLSLLYDSASSPEDLAAAHFDYGKIYDQRSERTAPPRPDPTPGRRLRLAFVSADFRMHSVAFFLEPLLSSLDREAYEVFLYSSVANPDDMTHRLYGQADGVRKLVGMTSEAILAQARKDQLDVAVELGGHTGNNCLPLMAQRLAPVQFSWLGYPHSTGLRAIDYRLSDACLEPLPKAQSWSSEQIVHLEGGAHTYRLPGEGIPVNALPMSHRGYPTFICCNNSAKISPRTLELFAGVLTAVPESRLLIKNSGFTYPPRAKEIHDYFSSRGIDPDRVELRRLTQTVRQHLNTYAEADIALDTYPYTGTTTTCEALWMGLPVISLVGDTAVARHTASLLQQVGLDSWATGTVEGYIAKAIEAVGQAGELARLRAGLRGRFRSSTLGDGPWFARRFENALRKCWIDYCERAGASEQSIAAAHATAAEVLQAGKAAHALHRGEVLGAAGESEEAAVSLREAGEAGLAEGWIALGKLGEQNECTAWSYAGWQQAVQQLPDRADLWAAWAEALRAKQEFAKACEAYAEAVSRAPEFPGVWMNYAATCRLANRPLEAEEKARRALALKPDFAEAWNNLGGALRDQGRFEEAIEAWIQALELNPNDRTVHSNLLYLLNAVPGMTHDALRSQHQTFGERHFTDTRRREQWERRDRDKPIRIGFLSPDLRDHSVARFLQGVLPALRENGFELSAFADVAQPDAMSEVLRTAFHRWTRTVNLDDEALAEVMRASELDVLIELSGHTAGNRLGALCQPVAPLHLSWLGYPTALEAGVTDYFLTDETIYPVDDRPGEVLCLEGGALAFCPDPRALEWIETDEKKGSRPLTFGAFHSFHKLNESLWRDWAAVLEAFPGSRLCVKSRALSEEKHAERWRETIASWGVPAARVDQLAYRDRPGEHLLDWNRVDIALDAWPYNGVTTTAEALSMGVPVVTLPGYTPASRHAASLLKSVDRAAWIAPDLPGVVACIEEMATNLPALRAGRRPRAIHFHGCCAERGAEWVAAFESVLRALNRSPAF